MPDPPATTETNAAVETAPRIGHTPSNRQDLTKESQEPTQDNLVGNKQEYPVSEIDAWDWDVLFPGPCNRYPAQHVSTTLKLHD